MQESNINIDTKTSNVNLLSKVYIWSIVMEPLLYFLMFPPSITGVSGGLGRVLQIIVIIGLFLRLLINGRVIALRPFSPLNINFTYYFIFAIFVGFYGLLSGAYSLNFGIDNFTGGYTYFSHIMHSSFVRPFFEYLIAFYYFAYFVVLARYLISNKEAINYFFKLFIIVFFVCVLIGYVDLLLLKIFPDEIYMGFPRHFYNDTRVGFRFHGIAGEPRDAFSYLILGLGILSLRDIWKDEKKLTFFLIIFIAITATLTQSMSGLIGIIFCIPLIIIFYLPSVSLKVKLISIFFILITSLIVVINVTMSSRLMSYYTHFFTLYSELNSGSAISPTWSFVMNNVYPIWHLWLKIKEFEFLPFIIGSGLGSVRVVNNYYMSLSDLTNPNAFIIRSIYETGVIGTLLFINAFLAPIKRMYIDYQINNKLRLLMILMLGMYFAHRTAIPYIFLGIALVVIKNKLIISDNTY